MGEIGFPYSHGQDAESFRALSFSGSFDKLSFNMNLSARIEVTELAFF
jgi:hypothetical protein